MVTLAAWAVIAAGSLVALVGAALRDTSLVAVGLSAYLIGFYLLLNWGTK